jgi:CheY-like chemotaxis protein
MYSEYLSVCGFRVAAAQNGLEAVEKTRALLPDVVLMDLSLPIMDGWEATRQLKQDELTRHIPVIALTGHALVGYAESARRAGCDAFVTKPCLPEALVDEVNRMLARVRAAAAAASGAAPARSATAARAARSSARSTTRNTVTRKPRRLAAARAGRVAAGRRS